MARERVSRKTPNDDGSVTLEIFERPNRLVKLADGTEDLAVSHKHTSPRFQDFPAPIQVRVGQHGLGQKYGDTFADADSPAAILIGLKEMDKQLLAGNWSEKGEGGPKAPAIHIEALMRWHNSQPENKESQLDLSGALARFNAKSKDQQENLKKNKKIVQLVASITEERAKARKNELRKAASEEADPSF